MSCCGHRTIPRYHFPTRIENVLPLCARGLRRMAADHHVSRRRQVRASNPAICCCPSGALHSHQSALTAVSHRNIHILIATKKYWDWFNSWFGKLSCALRLMEDLTTRAGLVSNNCWRNIFELPDGICFTKSLRAIPATSSEIISQSRFRQFARMFSISISLLLLIPPSLHLFSFSLSLSFSLLCISLMS